MIANVKADVMLVLVAARDSRTPVLAKTLALATVAYAFCPIDLIPDFIPILGYLDDLILVPLGIYLTIRLIPARLITEYRQKIKDQQKPSVNPVMVAIIIGIWILCAWLAVTLIYNGWMVRGGD